MKRCGTKVILCSQMALSEAPLPVLPQQDASIKDIVDAFFVAVGAVLQQLVDS